jgi:hypothetical protein
MTNVRVSVCVMVGSSTVISCKKYACPFPSSNGHEFQRLHQGVPDFECTQKTPWMGGRMNLLHDSCGGFESG